MSPMNGSLEQMNLNLLLSLHWLLTEQNVTRAARRMGVTQSAMSRSLSQLRDFFADPLLRPVGRGLEPTAVAVELREPLARAIDGLRDLLRDKGCFDPAAAEGEIVLSATEHATAALVPLFLARLRRLAPQLKVYIEPAGPDAWSLLSAGRTELLLAPKIGPLPKGLVAENILQEEFVTVLRKGHPAAKDSLTLRRYAELEHIVVYPLGGNRVSLVCNALASQGRERRVSVRVPYFSSAIDIVSKSDLVLTLPSSLAPKRLCIRRPPLGLPGFVLQSVWPKRLNESPLHIWIRDLLRQVGGGLGAVAEIAKN